MAISEKLLYVKQRSGWSAEELSRRSGVPLGTLNKLLTGQTRQPSAAAFSFSTSMVTPSRSSLSVCPHHSMSLAQVKPGTNNSFAVLKYFLAAGPAAAALALPAVSW